jgi:hypothetical protein
VQVGEDALDERRAGGEREQIGQEGAQAVADCDSPVGARDADVNVEAERVVAPDNVAEQLVVPTVVRRVDDPLVAPRTPRVRADAAERDAERLGQRRELPATVADARRRLGERLAAACADLDL